MSRFKQEREIGKKVIAIGITITDDGPLVIEHDKEYKQVMRILSSTFKAFMELSMSWDKDKEDNGEDVTGVRYATILNVLGAVVTAMIVNDVFPFRDLSDEELGTLFDQFMDAIGAHQDKPDA
jgi:hypothetical protein